MTRHAVVHTEEQTMTPTVQIHSREGLEERRAKLVTIAGGDETALRRAAADYRLTVDQIALLDEIDRIDYLLGAD